MTGGEQEGSSRNWTGGDSKASSSSSILLNNGWLEQYFSQRVLHLFLVSCRDGQSTNICSRVPRGIVEWGDGDSKEWEAARQS